MKITLSHNIFVHEPHFTFDTFLIIGNSLDFPIKWLLENPIDKYYDKIFAEHERINEISKTNVILTSFYMQHFRIDIDDYKDSSEFSVTTNHCKIVSIRWFRNPNSSNDLSFFFSKNGNLQLVSFVWWMICFNCKPRRFIRREEGNGSSLMSFTNGSLFFFFSLLQITRETIFEKRALI